MCPVVGSASPCRRCSLTLLLWGLTDVLSRALDAELCRSGGAVQVVGVERGERRGDAIPSLPALGRYALEGHPLDAGDHTMTASTGRRNNSSILRWVSWAEGLRQLEGGAGLRELLAGY